MVTAINRVYKSLIREKKELTAKQIKNYYSVSNPYDVIYELRERGYGINLVKRTDSNGRVTSKYTTRHK